MWYQPNLILIDRPFGAMWGAWKRESRMNLPTNDPFRFWIMFNLGIQDIMTGRMKAWKCEWNWNVNQEKQTLYTTAQV